MPLYALIGFDGEDGPRKRDEHRAPHLAHWEALDHDGRIRFAGPLKDDAGETSTGAVILFEAADLAEARRIAHADPFVAAGVFAELRVAPIKHVFPKAP